MADSRSEQPAPEAASDPDPGNAGPQVPKARTGEPEFVPDQPVPGKRPAKRAAKAAPTTSPETAKAAKPAKSPGTAKGAAKPAKVTGRKKAAKTSAPDKPTEAALPKPAGPASSPAVNPATPYQPPDAWLVAFWEAFSQPDQVPDRLLRMVVQEVGPRAAGWLAWVRQTYPDAPTSGIARLATQHATRTGRMVAMAGFGGLGAAPFTIPAVLLIRANLVLRIAAAYGHDPLHQQRAADLVELLGLAPADPLDWLADLPDRGGSDPDRSESGAETPGSSDLGSSDPGTGAAGEPPTQALVAVRRIGGILKRVDAFGISVDRLRLTRRSAPMLGVYVLLRLTDKAEEVERLAHRAIRFYRPGSSSSTDSSAPST